LLLVWATLKCKLFLDSVVDLSYSAAMTLFERWAQFVEITETCWFWRGTLTTAGYGHFNFEGRTYIAHRVAIELFIGPFPPGYVSDHLCRVHACVFPFHLERVTCKENVWRGLRKQSMGWGACPHGYPRKRDCYDCREVYRLRYELRKKAGLL
jgi:hypothetical protein